MRHFILGGSHPLLSLAEAAVMLGGSAPAVIDDIILFDRPDWDGTWIQDRLAGAVKVGDIFGSYPLNTFSVEILADIIDGRPRGNKVVFGISFFGPQKDRNKFKQLPIQLKRAMQERKRSVRWFAGDGGEVSSAAVAKLDLINDGYDIQIIIQGQTVHVGFTTHVQNSDAWSDRDFGRPFRDATTGMLPPKLARLMVNLAGKETTGKLLLDPFCGGGTVLMEGGLVGYTRIIGSDIDARQVGGTKENNDWLVGHGFMPPMLRDSIKLFTHRVETLQEVVSGPIDVIVTEGFLGKPLNGTEPRPWLEQQKKELETLWDNTFKTFGGLQAIGGIVVASIPIHRFQQSVIRIDADTAATAEGYHRVDPLTIWHIPTQELIYAREEQRVQRRLCIWKKTT